MQDVFQIGNDSFTDVNKTFIIYEELIKTFTSILLMLRY